MTTTMTPQITLLHGDCLELMGGIESGSVDAVITDPPYGTQGQNNGYGRRQLHDKGDGMGKTILNDENLDLVRASFPHFPRLVSTGWGMVFFSPKKTPEFINATSAGEWFGNVVWDKRMPGLGYHIRYQHEDIAVFRFGAPTRPTDALLSVISCHSMPTTDHPHEKPLHLMRRLIAWATKPGDVVLDPFMGSGSTGVACVQENRAFIGIEKSEEYYNIACQRIERARAQLQLF